MATEKALIPCIACVGPRQLASTISVHLSCISLLYFQTKLVHDFKCGDQTIGSCEQMLLLWFELSPVSRCGDQTSACCELMLTLLIVLCKFKLGSVAC
jgi:hypothetical protein